MNALVPPARGRKPVLLPVQWQDCGWTPRMLVRPGAPVFTWLTHALAGPGRRTRGYRRLIKGAQLRSISRALRHRSGRIHFWRLPRSRKTIL